MTKVREERKEDRQWDSEVTKEQSKLLQQL